MISEFQCLYLEDDNDDYETFRQTLERAMQPTKLVIERAKTIKEAFEILDARGKQIQILFADLLMADDSKDGLDVVEYVRGLFPNIVIIGISKAEGSHPGTQDEFKERAGQDSWFFDKRRLKNKRDYTYERIRSEIAAVAAANGYPLSEQDACELEWTPGKTGNEKLDAEIDSAGSERLAKLLKLIAPESIRFTPFYLTPGMSNATVLRVRGTAEGKPPRNLLVKLSTDGRKLAKELAAAPKEGEPASNIYAPYVHTSEPWHYDGTYAIAARFEEDAITLERWLTNPDISANDTVGQVFDELFTHGLGKAYREGKKVDGTSAMAFLAPSVRTTARILIGLESIETLLHKMIPGATLDVAQSFIRHHGLIKTHPLEEYPTKTYVCWSHGDLHTRNILVEPDARSRPRLIDAARRAERHWASDPARLCADLWITNWDRDPDSYFWEKLSQWRQFAASWRHDESVAPGKKNKRVWEALLWIRRNLPKLFDSATEESAYWQFQLALAIEFLTMSGYPDIPMPKRCLGAIAATDILIELDSSIPWLH